MVTIAEDGKMKYNYLSLEEATMKADEVNLQIAIGLERCQTKAQACALLEDIRKHERFIMELIIREQFGSLMVDILDKPQPDYHEAKLQTAKINTLQYLQQSILRRMGK